jgi:hypothetical protein
VMLRLRITLPDRPGSLGRVSRVLGALGADILAVTVLDHTEGRVVDEFTVSWPNYPGRDRLLTALSGIPGVALEGAWATVAQPDAFADLDVLGHITADPGRALVTLVDALPGIFSADWAVVLGAPPERAVLQASWQTPETGGLPDITPVRPLVFSTGPDAHFAAVPMGRSGRTLYLARTSGPAFHRVELQRLARVVEIVLAIAGDRSAAGLRADAESGRARSGEAGA